VGDGDADTRAMKGQRVALVFVALVGLVALTGCGTSGPPTYPLATTLARRLERDGLCPHPRLNVHRRREVLCAPRADGSRTGVATFVSHRSALHSIDLWRRSARFIGCDFRAVRGALTFVVGPRFVVTGSDRPEAVARSLDAAMLGPPAACRQPDPDPT
jgi:hypothetical protein